MSRYRPLANRRRVLAAPSPDPAAPLPSEPALPAAYPLVKCHPFKFDPVHPKTPPLPHRSLRLRRLLLPPPPAPAPAAGVPAGTCPQPTRPNRSSSARRHHPDRTPPPAATLQRCGLSSCYPTRQTQPLLPFSVFRAVRLPRPGKPCFGPRLTYLRLTCVLICRPTQFHSLAVPLVTDAVLLLNRWMPKALRPRAGCAN